MNDTDQIADPEAWRSLMNLPAGTIASKDQIAILGKALGCGIADGVQWQRTVSGWKSFHRFEERTYSGTMKSFIGDLYALGIRPEIKEMAEQLRHGLRDLSLQGSLPVKGYRVTSNVTGVGWGITVWFDSDLLTGPEMSAIFDAASNLCDPYNRWNSYIDNIEYSPTGFDRLSLGWRYKRRP